MSIFEEYGAFKLCELSRPHTHVLTFLGRNHHLNLSLLAVCYLCSLLIFYSALGVPEARYMYIVR